jgi:hypothetical protein
MPYWMLVSLFVLTAALATYEVFGQTSDYETGVRRELVRLNRMASLRGDPPMSLSAFRQEIITRSLALASTAFKRQFER